MALSGSYDASGAQVSGLGVPACVSDTLQRRFRAHHRTAKYRLRYPGDEDHSARRGVEGVFDFSHLSC